MANTKIQIKRSTGTSIPTDGSLTAGELAYSYSSKLLYLGTANGAKVDVIGGKFLYDHANAAFSAANSGTSGSNSYAELIGAAANTWANGVGAAANSWANAVGAAGNSYAEAVGTAGNNYTNSTYVKLTEAAGQTVTGDLSIAGNLTITGYTTYANTQTLNIGDNIFVLNADLPGGSAPSQDAGMEINRGSSAAVDLLWKESQQSWQFTNDGTTYYQIASNTSVIDGLAAANAWSNSVSVAANLWSNAVGTAGNNYTIAVGAAGNAWANAVGTAGNAYADFVGAASNAWANAVGSAGNSYAQAIGSAANTNAANGSYISTGTVSVLFGGTGVNTLTTNGILYGDGTNPLKVTSAGSDGEVLQSDQGVPKFAMLDGGVF